MDQGLKTWIAWNVLFERLGSQIKYMFAKDLQVKPLKSTWTARWIQIYGVERVFPKRTVTACHSCQITVKYCEHWDYPDSESISVVAFEAWFDLWNCYLHFTCPYISWNDLVAVGNVIKLSILIPLRCDPTHVSESWLFLFGRSTYEYTYIYIYNIIMIYHWSKFPLVFGILQNYDSSVGLRTEPTPAVLNAANHGVMVLGPTMGIECCEDSRICLWGH